MVINDGNPIYSYDHPFNQTIINDNTVSNEAVITIPDRVNYMCVFVGGKGRDNKLIKQTTRSGFVSEFGKPDALKYGQPVLNAWSSIVDSYSHAYCMRVMPTDACYANIIVSLKYKVTDDGLATKVVTESVGGLNDVSKFSSIMDSKIEDSPDAEDYKTTPLFGIVSKGRGKYGNSYRIRLTPVSSKKVNQVYKFYRLELLDIDEGNTVVEAFEGTLYDYAINSISYLMSDVADGETSGSTKITIYNNEEAIEKIFTEYQLAAPSDKDMTYLLMDPIFGVNLDKTTQEFIKPQPITETSVALDRLDGVPLSGGNEGSLEKPPEGKTVDDVIEELYIKAFAGQIDRSILSTRRTPVKLMLDAGYPINVKRQMVQLGLKRYDAMIHLDSGLISTVDEALSFADETADLNYRIVSKEFQHFEIRDPFSGKRVPVTITYHLANALAKHIELYGLGVPFTGETYATLTGAIKNSLVPIIDESDEDVKEALYDARLNYYEAISENVFAKATQQTAQDVLSDLSEEHNMMIVLEIKDIAERETIARRYNFADAEDRALFKEVLNERVRYMRELVQELDVLYNMSETEEKKSIIHCYIDVTFKSIFKSSIIEINVNKRV